MLRSLQPDSVRGFTLLEMLVALSLASALMGIAAASLQEYNRSSKNASALIQGFLKQARIKAVSRTAAYKVYSDSSGRVIKTSFADTCSSPSFIADSALTLEMPTGARLLSPVWNVCFNARGLAESNITFSFLTQDAGTKQIEILLGGGTREL